jgi:lipoprotein signal peptidase
MIFVGALSNAFDRVTYGYTIDYLRVVNAIINIADILVVAGMIILVSKQVSAKK